MSIWPVEGGPERWPVYRGSDKHIAAGQGPGCDLGNQLGLPWIAVGDGGLVSYGYQSPDAGWFADLDFMLGGYNWQLRYCHGLEQPHPETENEWVGTGATARWPVKRGDVIGHVGYSGLTDPVGPAGAHLHNACWRDGVRVRPELLYALLQEQEEPMTPEQQRLHDIGLRAEAHLQTCIDVTRGWGGRLLSPGIPKRAEEKQAGKELRDVSKSMAYVLTGVQE